MSETTVTVSSDDALSSTITEGIASARFAAIESRQDAMWLAELKVTIPTVTCECSGVKCALAHIG
jgi:hypothetical protein